MQEAPGHYSGAMPEQSHPTPFDRCRLVLCLGPDEMSCVNEAELTEIFQAGDVASVIFSPQQLDESVFQKMVAPLVAAAQGADVAAVIADHSRVAGRVSADGLQLGQDANALSEAIGKFSPSIMVGAANVKTRHNALVIGELRPDYVMFGKPDGDIRPEPHPKNLDLGNWWSQMVEIPCIVMGGSALESVVDVAQSGAEFVALRSAIFAPNLDAKTTTTVPERGRRANELLDQHAPRFEMVEE